MKQSQKLFIVDSLLSKISGIRFSKIEGGFHIIKLRPLNMIELIELDNVIHKIKRFKMSFMKEF